MAKLSKNQELEAFLTSLLSDCDQEISTNDCPNLDSNAEESNAENQTPGLGPLVDSWSIFDDWKKFDDIQPEISDDKVLDDLIDTELVAKPELEGQQETVEKDHPNNEGSASESNAEQVSEGELKGGLGDIFGESERSDQTNSDSFASKLSDDSRVSERTKYDIYYQKIKLSDEYISRIKLVKDDFYQLPFPSMIMDGFLEVQKLNSPERLSQIVHDTPTLELYWAFKLYLMAKIDELNE